MFGLIKFVFPRKWKHLKPGIYTATIIRVRLNRKGNLEMVLSDTKREEGS